MREGTIYMYLHIIHVWNEKNPPWSFRFDGGDVRQTTGLGGYSATSESLALPSTWNSLEMVSTHCHHYSGTQSVPRFHTVHGWEVSYPKYWGRRRWIIIYSRGLSFSTAGYDCNSCARRFPLKLCSRGRPFLVIYFLFFFLIFGGRLCWPVLPFLFLYYYFLIFFRECFSVVLSRVVHRVTAAGSLEDDSMCDNQSNKSINSPDLSPELGIVCPKPENLENLCETHQSQRARRIQGSVWGIYIYAYGDPEPRRTHDVRAKCTATLWESREGHPDGAECIQTSFLAHPGQQILL